MKSSIYGGTNWQTGDATLLSQYIISYIPRCYFASCSRSFDLKFPEVFWPVERDFLISGKSKAICNNGL